MLVGAALGREPLTARKSLGVAIAMAGVFAALAAGAADAPHGAWRGDVMTTAAMLSMALYNVLSRPLMARSSALGYATAGMAFGSAFNLALAWIGGGLASVASFGRAEWASAMFLGIFAGGIGFYLWVYALQRITPTQVASTITVSPIAAALLGAALLGEPIGPSLLVGVAAIATGIWIASSAASAAETSVR